MGFSPDGNTLAFLHHPKQRAVVLWDLAKQQGTTLSIHNNVSIGTMKFTIDGKHLVMCSADAVDQSGKSVWHSSLCYFDCKSGELVKKVILEPKTLLAFSDNGRVLIHRGNGDEQNVLTVTNMATEKKVVLVRQHMPQKMAAFSPDSSLVATSDGQLKDPPHERVHVWESATGKLRQTFSHKDWKGGPIPTISMSPDNKILAVHGLQHLGLQFFDLVTGKEIGEQIRPVAAPIVFVPDSKHLVAISVDNWHNLDIWNVATQKKVKTLFGTKEEMGDISLALSPNGRYIARCNSKGSISIWEVPKLDP